MPQNKCWPSARSLLVPLGTGLRSRARGQPLRPSRGLRRGASVSSAGQGHGGVTGDGVGRAAGSQWPCNDIRGPRCSGGDLSLVATWWVARATFRTCSPCVSPASPLSSSLIQLSTDGTEGLRLVTPHAGRVSHGCTHRRQEGFRNPGGPETWKWCTPLLEASLFSGEELQANTTEGPHLGV